MSENLTALLPPLVVLVLFVVVIRAIIRADRSERAARAKIEQAIENDIQGGVDNDRRTRDDL